VAAGLRPWLRITTRLFTHVDGRPFDSSSVTKTFFAPVKRSGLRHVKSTGLRRPRAHVLMTGVPALTVSRRLGHSTVVFTQDR
jgi:integrase